MKIIVNAPEDEIEGVVRLILSKKSLFDRTPKRLGWGWDFHLENGSDYFLRQIKGGISANVIRREARDVE